MERIKPPNNWKYEDLDGWVAPVSEPLQYGSIPRQGVKDASYPVDVWLFDGNGEPALGNIYYKDDDFKGSVIEASMTLGGYVKGSSLIYGHLRGFGYMEFVSKNVEGSGYAFPSIGFSTMSGKYIRGKGIPSPTSFEGDGESSFLGGGSAQTGEWESYNDKGEPTWKGKAAGLSISLPFPDFAGDMAKGKVKTKSDITYPKLNDKTKIILELNYDQ